MSWAEKFARGLAKHSDAMAVIRAGRKAKQRTRRRTRREGKRMSELPPAGPAPTPASMEVPHDAAEGRACIVCFAPGHSGMDVNIFMGATTEAGRVELWACPGACSDTMFERLGFQ